MAATPTPYDLPPSFHEFALMPRFAEDIEFLAEHLAEPEDWDYHSSPSTETRPVLCNYVRSTYRRIAQEKKIVVTPEEAFACWNTGLVTDDQEMIYIVFEENKSPERTSYWYFRRFVRKGHWELNRFPALPEMARYYDDPSLLVYDARKALRPDLERLVADNRDRLPSPMQSMSDFALHNLMKGAVDAVVERVKRDYKTAVPQWNNGTVQLLLPLCMTDPATADLALVVEQFPEFYRASTCLPLQVAYNNARQLARPGRDWLRP